MGWMTAPRRVLSSALLTQRPVLVELEVSPDGDRWRERLRRQSIRAALVKYFTEAG